MISCKRATELISRSLDEELSIKEKLALHIHLYICEFCELFRVQLEGIRKALKLEPPAALSKSLSAEKKAKLKDLINRS